MNLYVLVRSLLLLLLVAHFKGVLFFGSNFHDRNHWHDEWMENDRNIDTQTYIYIFERLRDAIERSEFTLYSFGDVSFDCLHFEYLNLTIKNNDTSAKKKRKKKIERRIEWMCSMKMMFFKFVSCNKFTRKKTIEKNVHMKRWQNKKGSNECVQHVIHSLTSTNDHPN